MTEKRQGPLENLEPKNMSSLVAMTAKIEATLRDFRLERAGVSDGRQTDSIKHNRRGEEVERQTGYVHPLPPAE